LLSVAVGGQVTVSDVESWLVGGESDGGPVSVPVANQVAPSSAENASYTQPQLTQNVPEWSKLPVTGVFG
jgi:hypothetical protein